MSTQNVQSRSGAGLRRTLPAAMRATSGNPGNPNGYNRLYAETTQLARQAAPDAIRRLIELMESEDGRVTGPEELAQIEAALKLVKARQQEKNLQAPVGPE